LAYNGSEHSGWQVQPNAPSIQQEISDAMARILRHEVDLVGCGRTDTGVHAKDFYAHFDTETMPLAPIDLLCKLNSMLHPNIALTSLFRVKEDAHARFDATERSYEYLITNKKDPFKTQLAYRFDVKLDLDKMNDACGMLLGKKDFGCFCKSKAQNVTDICDVREARWEQEGNLIRFQISADRFLRNMVRAIVGTMLDIGQNRTSLEEFSEILRSGDRSEAGRSVPAHGLYLVRVQYPEHIFLPNL
jgi:tRNA pseudouridine38-40 synthase